MRRAWIGAVAVAGLAGALLGGGCCCGGGGSSTRAETNINSTTTGQQLIDLQKAYESGALSEKEYTKQKEIILDKAKK